MLDEEVRRCHVRPSVWGAALRWSPCWLCLIAPKKKKRQRAAFSDTATAQSSQVILAITKTHFPSFEITDVRSVWNKDPFM